MFREIFTALAVDLGKLNQNELVIVRYDKTKHLLSFHQLNQMIIVGYLSPYFLPKKGFELGVLTPPGLNKLLYNLSQLLQGNLIDNGGYIPDLQELGTGWYRYFKDITVPTPQLTITLKYCNVTNPLIVKILCNRFNNNSRIIYRSIKNSLKLSRKMGEKNNISQSTELVSNSPKTA